jgi:AcrR family transcriptional regulator
MAAKKKPIQRRLKADERRLTILSAAIRLFIEKGYAATRMEEIADAAGCTTGPLYHFFKTKYDVFAAVQEQTFEQFVGRAREHRETINQQSPLARMKASIDMVLDEVDIARAQMFMRETPIVLGEQKWSGVIDELMTRSFESDLRDAMMDNLIEPEPPGPLAELFSSAVVFTISRADPKNREPLRLSKNAILRMVDRLEV